MPRLSARFHQLVLALVFLTRLPLTGLLPRGTISLAACAWAFPVAGLLVGAVAGLPLWLDGPPLLLAALSVALAVWLTGALHEDGLADLADGMGGQTPAARLEIMRDSRIGAYGTLALILLMAIRVPALAEAGPLALIAAATCGRVAIVMAMALLPPARNDGLGRAGQGVSAPALTVAALIGILTLFPMGKAGALAAIAGGISAAMVMRLARQKLGGQTGDVLGASSVVTETAMLVAFALTA